MFRGDGGLVVVSPPTWFEARDYDALAELGPVRALVANNSYHHLGQGPVARALSGRGELLSAWGALPRLAKKAAGIPFRSLAELKLPAHVHWEDPPGFKAGEAILRVKTGKGSVWFTGDLLTTLRDAEQPLWLDDEVDRLRAWIPPLQARSLALHQGQEGRPRVGATAQLAEAPPTIVVPAHGPPITTGDVAELARAQIERL